MKWQYYAFLILLNAALLLGIAQIQEYPGYMDADYYYLGGQQLALGNGFTEPVLWNYLDDPEGLPHPSHTYWMPLASILSAMGLKLFGAYSFPAARLGFLLLALSVPPMTAALSYQFTGKPWYALLSGSLAVFSGFYLPFIITMDTFTIMMFLGASLFLLDPSTRAHSRFGLLAAGLVTGLFHLTRSDGLLWLPIVVIFLWFQGPSPKDKHAKVLRSVWVILGYGLIMAPWIYRNLIDFGTPLAPGGLRTLWSTSYDELFSYPASQLNVMNWMSSGLDAILESRLWALGINLQRTLAEQGVIFLTPLILFGMWRTRSDPRVKLGFWVWSATFIAMTFVFPFAGARGGLFHSCAAFQPLYWAVVPVGLESFIQWGQRHRDWQADQARVVFGTGLVIIAAVLSGGVFYQRAVGNAKKPFVWNQPAVHYQNVDQALKKVGALPEDIVMVNNPPGYAIATQRRAIVIPDGDVHTLLDAAARYDAQYVVVGLDHPRGLDDLYDFPKNLPQGLIYLISIDGAHIFRIQ